MPVTRYLHAEGHNNCALVTRVVREMEGKRTRLGGLQRDNGDRD